jgi:hypothetical protein
MGHDPLRQLRYYIYIYPPRLSVHQHANQTEIFFDDRRERMRLSFFPQLYFSTDYGALLCTSECDARDGLSSALSQPVVMTAASLAETTARRLDEIAEMLALGLQRLHAKKSSQKSAEAAQKFTGVTAASERSWCTPVQGGRQ